MGLLLDYKNLITSVYAVLLVTLYFAISWLVWRPGFPKGSPKRLTEGYPILGVVRFFSARRDFYIDGIQQSPSGQFSFYFGKHRIVALSGEQGRKSFFENKELDMPEGYGYLTDGRYWLTPRLTPVAATPPSSPASPRSKWTRRTTRASLPGSSAR